MKYKVGEKVILGSEFVHKEYVGEIVTVRIIMPSVIYEKAVKS
jgi:hypothetical protein